MTKRYHTQEEICHLFVEQSPDCTSADLRGGNLNFNGPTLTSFGWWTLATWTGRTAQAPKGREWSVNEPTPEQEAEAREIVTKRVLLRCTETHGRSGWNSDGKQQNILDRALRGREDYVEIGCNQAQIKTYLKNIDKSRRAGIRQQVINDDGSAYVWRDGDAAEEARLRDEAWTKLGEELVNEEIARLKARAQRYAKPTVYANGVDGPDNDMEARIRALDTKEIEARAAQFGLDAVAYFTEGDLMDVKDIVRQGYAKYNDPAKVKARLTAGRRSGIISLRKLVSDALSTEYRRFRSRTQLLGYDRLPDASARNIIDRAFETHPQEAATLLRSLAERLAVGETVATFRLLHPNAQAVIEQRRYGGHTKYITADEWRDGKNGTIKDENPSSRMFAYYGQTYVRRENAGTTRDEIVTSLGARVPFKDGVKLYKFAASVLGVGYQPPPDFKVGFYQLNEIKADGTCRIGCHTLDFAEMERLAVREVPHLVRARYPVPSLYIKRDALDMALGYSNGGDA